MRPSGSQFVRIPDDFQTGPDLTWLAMGRICFETPPLEKVEGERENPGFSKLPKEFGTVARG